MRSPPPTPADLLGLFVRHPLRWLLPALVVAAGTSAYAWTKRDAWEASLSLMVRGEAGGNALGAGRFRDLSEMKTLEETVLEIAKNRAVLTAALTKVGPPADADSADGPWPSPEDVDDLADALKIVPPKGTEFGSTEVFYLKVKADDPERAVALADAVAEQLLDRFRQLRDTKARSMVAELETAVELARNELNEAAARLKTLETDVGGDLGELRNLEQNGSGDSDLRKLVVELENEVRQSETARRNQRDLLELLVAAQADPARLPATPTRLLDSQPALRRLKDGLIDAQLRTSQLLGGMSREHPAVRSALEAENEVRHQLRAELETALPSVEDELSATEDVLAERRARLAAARARLDRLAGLRAEYSTVNAETQHRLRKLEEAERQLVDARAVQAGGEVAGLLTTLDSAAAGSKPLGPGRTTLTLVGVVGGLLIGAGCLLLTALPGSSNAFGGDAADVARRELADSSARNLRAAEAWATNAGYPVDRRSDLSAPTAV